MTVAGGTRAAVAGTLCLCVGAATGRVGGATNPPDSAPGSGAATGFQWFRTLHGPVAADAGNDIAVDAAGNVFVSGYHSGLDIDRDGVIDPDADDSDPVFLRFSPGDPGQGATLDWVTSAKSSAFQRSSAIAPDHAGGAFAVGRFQGDLSFGGTTVRGAGRNDAFLARLDPAGDPVWIRELGGPNDDVLFDVASDMNGNAYVTGRGTGDLPLDPAGARLAPGAAAGAVISFIASYDAAGSNRWTRKPTTSSGSVPLLIFLEVSPDGDLVVAGESDSAVDFDEDGSPDLSAPRDPDGFVAWFSRDGTFQRAWWIGAGFGRPAFTPTGDLLVLGAIGGSATQRYGPADFDGDGRADASVRGGGPTSAFVARYAPGGSLRWVRTYELEQPGGITTRPGQIVITGSYRGVRDLDEDGTDERVDRTVDPSLEWELAVLVLDERGEPQRAWTAPGPGHDHAAGAAFLPDLQTLFVTGYVQLTADFTGDGEDGEGWATCEARGDILLAEYGLDP